MFSCISRFLLPAKVDESTKFEYDRNHSKPPHLRAVEYTYQYVPTNILAQAVSLTAPSLMSAYFLLLRAMLLEHDTTGSERIGCPQSSTNSRMCGDPQEDDVTIHTTVF